MKFEFQICLDRSNAYTIYLEKDKRYELKEDTETWIKEFIKVFSKLQLVIEGSYVGLSICWEDWGEGIRAGFHNNISMKELVEYQESMGPEFIQEKYIKWFEVDVLNNYIIVSGVMEYDVKDYYVLDLMKIIIFHIWRCSNISYPGILNLSHAKIQINQQGKKTKGDIHLCTYEISYLFNDNDADVAVPIHVISISKTWSWYQKVVDFSRCYTENRFDRAITGLFYYIRHDVFIQANIIDLFLGIEAFYALGNSGIINKLVTRSLLFLQVQDNKRAFKKKVRGFNNYRSRYVHGDKTILEYVDILDNLFLSESNNKYYDEFYNIRNFAMYFLMISIQKAVIENKYDLRFVE